MRRLDPTALILCLAMLPVLGDFTRDVALPAWEMLIRVAGRTTRPAKPPKRGAAAADGAAVANLAAAPSAAPVPSADAAR